MLFKLSLQQKMIKDIDDLFLDAVNAVKGCDFKKRDAVFFFYLKDGEMKVTFGGTSEDLINSFITCMNRQDGFYDVLSTAVEAFEENAVIIEE